MSDDAYDGPVGSFGSVQEHVAKGSSTRTVGGVRVAESSEGQDERPLDELTVAELRQEASSVGLESVSKLKHDELVEAIQARYDELDAEQAPSDPEGPESDPAGSDDPDEG